MDITIEKDIQSVIDANRELLKKVDGRTFLITGGAGFLGSYFIDLIAKWNESGAAKPCQIYCLDTFITGFPKRLSHLAKKEYFHQLKQSVTDPLPDSLHADYILHFASIASPTTYRKYPLETIAANVWGLQKLLEYAEAKKVKSLLFLSTSEVYGDPPADKIPTKEDYRGNVSCFGPRACYDESKRLGETLCYIFKNYKNVPVKIVRPFNIYGPGLRLDDKRVLPDMFSGAFFKKEIVMHSDGSPTRSFCYVSDATDAFLKVLLSQHDGEAFNVGNDLEEISMNKLAESTGELFGGSVKVTYKKSEEKDYLTDNPQRRCPNLDKIKSMVGYKPKVMLSEGLSRLKKWYESELAAGEWRT